MPTLPEIRERAAVPYHRWSVEEFHRMAQSGLLDENDRVELINGELVDMAPIGSRHAFYVDRLAECLGGGPSASYMVRVQNPIVLDERSEPQPDIALVKRANYADRHPTAAEVLLIVEVSDTTLDYDRDVKLALYARHGIPDVWLIDVKTGELTIHREPVEGRYRLMRQPTASETVASLLIPAVKFALAELVA
jgi:Uma2 family endonuclease